MFVHGDWVFNTVGYFGVIWEVNEEERKAHVEMLVTPKGRRTEGFHWIKFDYLQHAPIEGFDNANDIFIDMALQTKDEEWFKTLTKEFANGQA